MTQYDDFQRFLMGNQRTWLITGVAGFIGSNLLEKLLNLNQRVVGLDNFDTGFQTNIEQALDDASRAAGRNLSENFFFINGDIRKLEHCAQACTDVDYVLHQAALGSVPRSIADPINTNRANVDGFLNMLVASRDEKVKRFVYAASSSTYGDHQDLPKFEDKIGKPLSPYAVTKLVNELYAEVFAKTYGVSTVGLRYFNVFGKRQNPNGAYAAVIPKWIYSLLSEDDVLINGDGQTSRDFCYVENAIQMNILAALTENSAAIDQVYNVALNDRTDLNSLFQMIQTGLCERVPSLEKNKPIYREFREGDVRHSQAHIGKAQTLLGYHPEYDIVAGLEIALDWYLKNKEQPKIECE